MEKQTIKYQDKIQLYELLIFLTYSMQQKLFHDRVHR